MRTIFFLLQKEFIQIFRNKMMLPIIFVMPIIQLLILSYTATFEIKNADIAFVDLSQSRSSRELIAKFKGSPFFTIKGNAFSIKQYDKSMLNGDIDIIIKIPNDFESSLLNGRSTFVQLISDAVNGSAANLMTAYALQILFDFNRNIITETYGKDLMSSQIKILPRYWFNPELNYKTYMVPGILVLLVSLIGAFLSGMNVVREKEIGTIEQLNVTPIKKYQFIIGKLFPFWVIAMVDLIFGLILAKLVFAIPILGSVALILGVAAIYMILVLAFGLFISTITDTQQQAMFIAWFFFVIFIIMSGLFTPVEGMPKWAQIINIINPIAYFIDFMRLVMLKGADFVDVQMQILKITVYAITMLGLSIIRYRKNA
ncbi:MAG: ABC transporter permease [Bacteroidetes bacterium CG2_30_33_31]|nr:MAG: ABC transporter permease [Bacteroidetes bacterium CG2_30_33_31]